MNGNTPKELSLYYLLIQCNIKPTGWLHAYILTVNALRLNAFDVCYVYGRVLKLIYSQVQCHNYTIFRNFESTLRHLQQQLSFDCYYDIDEKECI